MVAPFVTALVFSIVAMKYSSQPPDIFLYLRIIIGSLTLALANATSNVLNQVWDTVEDRNNPVKCHRPVASGEISEREAMGLAFFGMLMMILMAGFVNTTFTILVVLIMLFSFIYSVPPLRTKKRLWWNNITIAIPRGLVGVLASVSIVCNPFIPDFIAVGVIISMYTFAVNPTKDISDIEGDKVAGVRNFCTVYGVKKAMYISAFFLILTYVVTVLFVYFGIITNGWLFVLMLLPVGIAILYLMLFNPEKKFKGENTALWYLFYIQMIIIVVSFVATTIA
jgi:4-hydroxybenzoate polyprenyltransferase